MAEMFVGSGSVNLYRFEVWKEDLKPPADEFFVARTHVIAAQLHH